MRARSWLLPLGLLASMVWSIAVNFSMPSWFDPAEDCTLTLGRTSSAGVTAHSSWFPPRATCNFGDGRVYDFMSPTRSVVLTVIGIVIAVALAAGLALWVKSLFRTGGVIRLAEGVDLRQRRIAHFATALVTGALGTGAILVLIVIGLVFGGPPGILSALLIGIVGLAAIASALDRSVGPLPSTAAQSRRRGALAAVLMFVCCAIAAIPRFPVPQFWTVALSAGSFVVIVALQWSRARPSLPEPEHSFQPVTAGNHRSRRSTAR